MAGSHVNENALFCPVQKQIYYVEETLRAESFDTQLTTILIDKRSIDPKQSLLTKRGA